MNRISTLLAALALPLLAAGAPPTRASLTAVISKLACEQPTAGHVVYAGDSAELGDCLKKLDVSEIQELRITSAGGDAVGTLKLANRYRGHLDLLVVDGMCASSCANYLVPAARRVRVAAHSYVLLHGSISLSDFDARKEAITVSIRLQSPNSTDDDVNETIGRARDELASAIPTQTAFEGLTLACKDWLDPDAHGPERLLVDSKFLLVTPEMARRCLKSAHVEAFWAPEPQEQLAQDLGFYRARH